MKKILSVLAVMAVACSAFAQGQISFSSSPSTIQVKADPTATPVNIAAGAGYVSALWAPAGSAMTAWSGESLAAWLGANSAWSQVAMSPKLTAGGRVLATSITVPTTSAVDLILIAWAGSQQTFDEAYNAMAPVGFSSKISVTPSVVPSPPATVALGTAMTLTPTAIPEPSTFALAGLGAAADRKSVV